ncbi:MAG: hypothetical protein P4L85_16190 [Paludisphaera borealis]|uniref:hypothetical protein n=1 Tax=Paludisphaera borealis TaxID=1387353 RepID=UPI00284FA112|nr:hypothetical protein [Paludisphaera borealis]MDR3620893.1 hypothetical protein [Paludisphaera borealis]
MGMKMKLKPVVELGVAEAYAILVNHFGEDRLPPLEAVENEDWGRDLLLSRFEEHTAAELADAGLCLIEEEGFA